MPLYGISIAAAVRWGVDAELRNEAPGSSGRLRGAAIGVGLQWLAK
jgi:hypothetical protein